MPGGFEFSWNTFLNITFLADGLVHLEQLVNDALLIANKKSIIFDCQVG